MLAWASKPTKRLSPCRITKFVVAVSPAGHRLPARGQMFPLHDDLVLAGRQAVDLKPSLVVGEREGAEAYE